MSELIKITEQNGAKAVSARELHQFLEVETKFTDWINRRISEYGFLQGEDFEILLPNFEKQNGSGGHNKTEYVLTLDMAKELSMVERTEKGKQARRYFIEMEKLVYKQIIPVLPNKNKELQTELFELIRANLLKGDLVSVAKEYGFNKNTVKSVLYYSTYSPEIVKALYQKALSNKNLLRNELQSMINELKS